MENTYEWTDNPTVSGVSVCDTDVLNECLMHLKYDNGGKNPYSLLQPIWSDKKLNNISWLVSLGQPNSGIVYESVYELLQDEYQSGVDETETIGGVSINYKLSEKGYKITTDVDAYDRIYTFTGTSWFYVIDEDTTSFYLPRTNGFMQFGNVGGQFNEAGLPNITGQHSSGSYNISATGAFYQTANTTASSPNSGASTNNIAFDASRSSAIYGKSNTVQPNAVTGYLYFYVGDTVKNQGLIDVATLAEGLALKLDTAAAPQLAAHSAMPSDRYTNLTVGVSGTSYTAPADGYFSAYNANGSEGAVWLDNVTKKISIVSTAKMGFTDGKGWVVASKDDVIKLQYSGSFNTAGYGWFRFIYAEGAQ